MALKLVRHTTPQVGEGVCYGRTDLAVADSFEDELAVLLTGLEPPTAIVSSPLTRCRLLAERIADWAGISPEISEHWIEMDFGQWEGKAWVDIPRNQLDEWARNFLHYDGHGGESAAALQERITDGLDLVGKGTLVVTHSGCIKAALALRDGPAGWGTETPFAGIVTL